MTEDEMVGWYHQLNGHEFEQTAEPGVKIRVTICPNLPGTRGGGGGESRSTDLEFSVLKLRQNQANLDSQSS